MSDNIDIDHLAFLIFEIEEFLESNHPIRHSNHFLKLKELLDKIELEKYE